MLINFHFDKFLALRMSIFLAKVIPIFSVNFTVTNYYMNFNFSSKMPGDHNDKAACSNSSQQEEENAVREEVGPQFIQETSGTNGNMTTCATDGNGTTTGIEGRKLNKKCTERRSNKLINTTDTRYCLGSKP
jgi:hypothetical protein